jgi:hypothetical protein
MKSQLRGQIFQSIEGNRSLKLAFGESNACASVFSCNMLEEYLMIDKVKVTKMLRVKLNMIKIALSSFYLL